MVRNLPSSLARGLAACLDRPPWRRPVLACAVAASALTGLTLVPAAGAVTTAPPLPVPAADAGVLAPGVPHLLWHECGGGFSCSTAAVPLDYAHPASAKISIAVIKHPATDPARRIGTLFYNPGGPGGSGVDFMRVGYFLFPPAVRARFDILSFDPRGIGQSTVLRCFASNEQEQRLLSPISSLAYPTGRAQRRVWEDTYARFDKACAAHAGPLLAHDSTADVARDMDLLRRAVGDRSMNYYGNSYGTYLGATYAGLFPSKVRAMVLDGNADPVQWATGTGDSAALLGTLLRLRSDEGSAAALKAFLELCGRAQARSCAFSAGGLAATRAKLATLLNRLGRHPVTIGGTTYTKSRAVDTVVTDLNDAVPIPQAGDTGWSFTATVLQDLWAAASGEPAPATLPPRAWDFPRAASRTRGWNQRLACSAQTAPIPGIPPSTRRRPPLPPRGPAWLAPTGPGSPKLARTGRYWRVTASPDRSTGPPRPRSWSWATRSTRPRRTGTRWPWPMSWRTRACSP